MFRTPNGLLSLYSKSTPSVRQCANKLRCYATVQNPTEADNTLEIKDPNIIFASVMAMLEAKYTRSKLRFPKEILFLAGAPGAGKGTVTRVISRERGFTGAPIVTSDLLRTPQMQARKAAGIMVSDKDVVELVFEQLLSPDYDNGVIVDGFPRTGVQAECIKLLYDKMYDLRREFFHTELAPLFRRPMFRITVLFVEEKISIQRQLRRGDEVKDHNRMVRETGVGELMEERPTDMSESAAQARYQFFKDHTYESLRGLRDKFHYHFIDASCNIDTVQKNVLSELRYQSTFELAHDTYDSISRIPEAQDLTRHARQELVRRLDSYQTYHTALFKNVLEVLQEEFMHIIKRQALCGEARIRTENTIFLSDPIALNMALDVLTERGYQVILDYERRDIPDQLVPGTNKIICRIKSTFHFIVRYPKAEIRRTNFT